MTRHNRNRRQEQKMSESGDFQPGAPRQKWIVFRNVQEMLAMAESGYSDSISPDPTRRRPGLMNLFTYGRSVTMAIQTIKSLDAGFDEWWKPYQDEMAKDSLMKYFNTARTDILHEGALPVSVTIQANLDPSKMAQMKAHEPPGTVFTFYGEAGTGGSGWVVTLPDGSGAKVYSSLPEDLGAVRSLLHLPNPPTHHNGAPVYDDSVKHLGGLYIAALGRIVSEFEARFKDA